MPKRLVQRREPLFWLAVMLLALASWHLN